MAARGDELFLLGRNLEDMQASVADLTIRAPRSAHAGIALCDLEKPETFEPALDAAEAGLGKLDLVVVTAALFAARNDSKATQLSCTGCSQSTLPTRSFCRDAASA